MHEMKLVTHVVPVGFEAGKLIEGVRQHQVNKVVIVIGKGKEDKRVLEAAGKIEKSFKGSATVEYAKVDKEDVLEAVLDFLRIIKKEKDTGSEVLINAAGSLRNITIASYIAALVTDSRAYTSMSKYEDGKAVGIERIIPIPHFPIRDLPEEQMKVLHALLGDGANSLEELVGRLKPGLKKGSREFINERARLSYHVKALVEGGFAGKKGMRAMIELTKLGEIYVMGKISSKKVIRGG